MEEVNCDDELDNDKSITFVDTGYILFLCVVVD